LCILFSFSYFYQCKQQQLLLLQKTQPCPSCGLTCTHFHGHGCHYIGCINCRKHWCYVCGRKHSKNKEAAGGGCSKHPDCTHSHSCCKGDNILQHLVQHPYPHDTRCGCPICPDCKPGKSCPQCPGGCVVCKGKVPPGPKEMSL
jgi:hypothetical protein